MKAGDNTMTTYYGRKKTVIVVIAVIAVALGIFIAILLTRSGQAEDGCIEKQTTYKVTPTGAKIVAFNSIPKEVITSLKEYIKDNDYNGKDIGFIFQTSPFTAVSGYPWQKDQYYVMQIKYNRGDIDYRFNRSSIYIGDMVIDNGGNVIETQNLMAVDELSKIETEPSISFEEALQIARDYRNTNSSVEIWSWRFCTPRNDGEWVLCFMIKFKDVEETVYIDGFSGQIIE